MGNPTDELRARLDELGVEWETGEDSHGDEEIWWRSPVLDEWVCATLGEELGTVQLEHPMDITPEQAIAATVGMEKWEPSKEWKTWYNSLKHDNPTSIREAVENILYEAIDFGGDMGPNGNVWSGVDEGAMLTENCIDGWVESVESIAATVGKVCDKLRIEVDK